MATRFDEQGGSAGYAGASGASASNAGGTNASGANAGGASAGGVNAGGVNSAGAGGGDSEATLPGVAAQGSGGGPNFGSARSDYGDLAYGGRLDSRGLEGGGGASALGSLSGITDTLRGVGEALQSVGDALPTAKVLKPTPHAVLDYAMAGTLMAAPWLFGFSRNKKATTNSVVSGAAILGLSLMTRYPLGAVKAVPFPVHGAIETLAALMTTAAPWLIGFSRNKNATATHVAAGLATLGVVALTDYQAAENGQSNGNGGSDGNG
jgi:SPW repeat